MGTSSVAWILGGCASGSPDVQPADDPPPAQPAPIVAVDARAPVAARLPALVSFEPEGSYLHVPGRQGFDAPGVGSARYTGACQPAAYRELVAELDRLLDEDGRPRTKIRQRGH
jgi:hypothetical protein